MAQIPPLTNFVSEMAATLQAAYDEAVARLLTNLTLSGKPSPSASSHWLRKASAMSMCFATKL
jgi:hypothetical protein